MGIISGDDTEADIPPTPLEKTNAPFVERRKFPSQPSSSKFYVILQTIIGPILATTFPMVVIGLLYLWSDVRIIRGESIRIGDWQSSHAASHTDFTDKHAIASAQGATLKYQVLDCKSAIRRLEALEDKLEKRIRECEYSTTEVRTQLQFMK